MNASSHASHPLKPLNGLFGGQSLNMLENHIHPHDQYGFGADFHTVRLCSQFQCIFSASLRRGVGFEAFLGGTSQESDLIIHSPDLFSRLEHHASGNLVLVSQIETEEEASVAMRVNADFLQGGYWGKPEFRPMRRKNTATEDFIDSSFQTLLKKGEQDVFQELRRHNLEMGYFASEFLECAWSVAASVPLKEAATTLIKLSRVERIYLLDEHGIQVGANVFPKNITSYLDSRYRPMFDSTGSTW